MAETELLPEIWEPGLSAIFVGGVVDEQSHTFGFHHLHPRDRFWELLDIGGITPARIISAEERKALADGHAKGNVSEPVRAIFIQKKTSQVLRAGIGMTALNRRIVGKNERDKAAQPTMEDVEAFVAKSEQLGPGIVAFVTLPEVFPALFKDRYPGASTIPGLQPFRIANAEVWYLGSTAGSLRGEALTLQEDVFFALGERIAVLRTGSGPPPL